MDGFLRAGHICKERPAESVMGENVMIPALVSSDLKRLNLFDVELILKKKIDDPQYH